jgi:hypothetical protein
MTAIACHEARGRPRRLQVDRRRGHYYVCAVNAGRVAAGARVAGGAGPFRRHRGARRWYRRAHDLAIERDPWAWHYQWGTCRVEHGDRPGALNAALGIRAKGGC